MDEPSANLVARWQDGDEQAAAELYHRHARRLIALARSRLASGLNGRVDPEDVVQSAYRCFFASARKNDLVLAQGGDLWRLLVHITLAKVRDAVKHHTAGKRSIRAEQAFHAAGDNEAELLAQEPSPVAAAMLGDMVEHLMRSLKPHERRVVELRLQGHTLYEIAAHRSCSLATVCRILDKVKERLAEQSAQVPSGPSGGVMR